MTGTHRSGTTWVADMLSVPGIWHVHEPFNPKYGLWDKYFSFPGDTKSKEKVTVLMESIMSGRERTRVRGPNCNSSLMPLRLLPLPMRRVLVKDPIACLLSEFITDLFSFQTVVLFRHPAGFVHSLQQLGWKSCPDLRNFLGNGKLMEEWLHPFSNLLKKLAASEGVESKAALHGCLNYVLWAYAERNAAMVAICFEDLCAQPIERFEFLFDQLGLEYTAESRERHRQFCFSKNQSSYKAWSTERNSATEAGKWRKSFSTAELMKIRNVWEEFNLPLYRSDEEWSA